MLRLRDSLCEATAVPAAKLPFAGELMQVKAAEAAQWQGAAERVLRGLFFDPGKVTPAMVTAYARNLEDPEALEGIRRTARQLDLQDLEKFATTYRGLDLPILVIGGAADPIVPPEHLQRFVAELKHATLVMVPQCGHLLLDECPVAVERAIAGFLRGLE